MQVMEWPPISEALVKKLEESFPDRCPDETMNERSVWMAAGAARLVRKLRSVLRHQTESSNHSLIP